MTTLRHLETDTFSNKDLSSAVAIGVYTATGDQKIICDVSLDQVAGNGDYVVYVTRQINGAGSSFVLLPKTTCPAASGETAVAIQSGTITVRSGDVLTVMAKGLASDTTTPDTTVRWYAENDADLGALALLLYDWEDVVATVPDRSVLNALRFLRNKWAASDGTLTVYEEDDTTAAWTALLTEDTSASQITGSAPS